MADRERIVQPTEGTQDLGAETNDEEVGRPSSGTNTQLLITVKGGSKKKKNNAVTDDLKPKDPETSKEFLRTEDTDE